MRITITPEARELGIKVCMAVIRNANISNRSRPLDERKKQVIEKIKDIEISDNQILKGYRELYEKAGIKGVIPPAEYLINLIKKNGRLPNINTVVDCYNLLSVQRFLSIGSHDLAHINGDIIFRVTDGSEKYTPLGEKDTVKVSVGEYACMDEEKILCRMDLKQCDETKITKHTKEFMVYVQGNKYTEIDYLQKALQKVCELIKETCNGEYEIVSQDL